MEKTRICAFGDSVMKGVVLESVSPLKYTLPEKTFTDLCADDLGLKIDNFARFGSTLASIMKIVGRHLPQVALSKCTLLGTGGNDCDFDWKAIASDPSGTHDPFTPLTEFTIAYGKLLEKVRALGSIPVVLSLTPVVPDKYFAHITRDMTPEGRRNVLDWLGGNPSFISQWHEMYNFHVMGLAAGRDVEVIDITSAFYERPGYEKLICEDGAHPNAAGQTLMARALGEGLRKIAGRRGLESLGGIQLAFC